MKAQILAVLLAFSSLNAVQAAELPVGEKTVYLLDRAGGRQPIGTLTIALTGRYDLRLEENHFGDFFLSMRPFKCLTGSEKHWCHVPYPYANERRLKADDLTDLEYDLLFLWKGATEYGINMWNGVYYQLTLTDRRFSGTLKEVDMDVLSVPPEQGNLRPLTASDLHEADPDSHWLPGILIE
jgi:hypothetical protein